MIWVSGQDCGGTVNLLRQYDAGKLVGECDAAEGEEELCFLAGGGRPSVGGAYGEDEALDAVVAETTKAGGELFGGELLPEAIEKYGEGAAAARLVVQPIQQGGFGVEELGFAGNIA